MSIAPAFQSSELWKRTLANQGVDDRYEAARSRLRESFLKTRRTVAPLVEKIASQLPGLTIHDISHLDALWTVADVIIGSDYPINPAEAYVLGLAFLLHDAATSTFAYPNGIEGVRNTVEWKDYIAQHGLDEEALCVGDADYQVALFETLRILHAEQAANLPVHSWKAIDGSARYLIEDIELRNHYGRVIGRVAASHGEDIATVENEFAYVAPISPHSSLGLDAMAGWAVDSLKIAMLIRAVDAAHIDSLRAPDIRAALNEPTGDSKNHWLFQNKLSSLAINEKKEIYWSSSAFEVAQSDAWWRCFETCKMIDGEIKSVNRILGDQRRPVMRTIGVVGASDIEIFQRNVPVEGWDPVDFDFNVSQVGKVIERFGGEKLYGDKPYLALRELIQNSSDAIRARRLFTEDGVRGKIEVSLRKENDEVEWLEIQHDGVGMSRFVLTDVLLDFGRSLWKDPALRHQWTGLASKGFGSVGQFGIGFFSIFMLGDEVKVTTWRYGSSVDQQLTLHLRNGVHARPLLVKTPSDSRIREPGTKISVRLKSGRSSLLRKIYVRTPTSTMEQQLEPLERLVGSLAPALDIDLWCKDGNSKPVMVVEANDWKKISAKDLLKRLAIGIGPAALDKYAPLVSSLINKEGETIGRATIYASARKYLRSDEYGVLIHKGIVMGRCSGMLGIIQATNSSDLARRSAVPVADAKSMRKWAQDQIELRNGSTPQISERLISIGDAHRELIVGRMNGKYVSVGDLAKFLKESPNREIVCLTSDIDCPEDISQNEFDGIEYGENVLDLTECYPDIRYNFGLDDWLSQVYSKDETDPSTILELIRYVLTKELPDLKEFETNKMVGETTSATFEETCIVFSTVDDF